jgi:hypothetical protein
LAGTFAGTAGLAGLAEASGIAALAPCAALGPVAAAGGVGLAAGHYVAPHLGQLMSDAHNGLRRDQQIELPHRIDVLGAAGQHHRDDHRALHSTARSPTDGIKGSSDSNALRCE